MRALSTAATGMMAQQRNVEVISNNIANMNTTGFKRARADVVPAGVDIGLGVKTAAIARIHTQGSLINTENRLDLALDGRGYFIVELPDGEQAYTRAGSFQLSPEGMIVTVDGYEIQPGIAIPQNTVDIQINQNGEVMAYVENQMEPDVVGQLNIATFVNDAGLEAIGNNLYRETPASGPPEEGVPGDMGFGLVRQGWVEASNVNVVQEITSLISAQRAYEMNSKALETADQMAGTVSNLR